MDADDEAKASIWENGNIAKKNPRLLAKKKSLRSWFELYAICVSPVKVVWLP